MSKYSKPHVAYAGRKTTNLAGGESFTESPELEFVSILLTSFLKDQFYRDEAATVHRIKVLVEKVPGEFAAKTAVFARKEFAMRSVSHLVAALLGNRYHGTKWGRKFFKRVVNRADDVLEILACYIHLFGKDAALPHALRNGLGDALSEMNEYQLGKYAKWNSDMKMVDAVNLCHPKRTEALKKLINGTLTAPETWEVGITKAGSDEAAKSQEWSRLLLEKKLGYMALIRNIRNIVESCPDLISELCGQLVNGEAIKKSLILPFRFMTAINVVENEVKNRRVAEALVTACDLSVANCPEFPGKTLIALDDSGSMGHPSNPESPAAKGALFAAALYRRNDSDLMLFSNDARYVHPLTGLPVLSLARNIQFSLGGTNLNDVFLKADKKYDRIIILTDFQAWMQGQYGYDSKGNYVQLKLGHDAFKSYKARIAHFVTQRDSKLVVPEAVNTKIYCFDLQGYGSLQFPEENVYCLAGFSDRIFDIMAVCEEDPTALLNRVNGVQL